MAALLVSVGCGTHNVSDQTAIPLQTSDSATAPTVSQSTAPATTAAQQPSSAATAPARTATASNGGAPGGMPPAVGGASVPDSASRGAAGGDEQGTRVPAAFTLATGAADPAKVTVAPFLDVDLQLRSVDGKPHVFTLVTRTPVTVSVAAGGTVHHRVGGLQKGTYPIRVDGKDTAAQLVVAETEGP